MLHFDSRFIINVGVSSRSLSVSSTGQNIFANVDKFATNCTCNLCMNWIRMNIKLNEMETFTAFINLL